MPRRQREDLALPACAALNCMPHHYEKSQFSSLHSWHVLRLVYVQICILVYNIFTLSASAFTAHFLHFSLKTWSGAKLWSFMYRTHFLAQLKRQTLQRLGSCTLYIGLFSRDFVVVLVIFAHSKFQFTFFHQTAQKMNNKFMTK